MRSPHIEINFTVFEMKLLSLISYGRLNKEMAHLLNANEQTLKNHVAALAKKTGTRNRAHLAALAIARGWASLPEEVDAD